MITPERLRKRLKLRDFEALLAVARCGSMARGAAELSVSQPAVSKAIAELEHTMGVPLFDRTARGVELTLYGEIAIKCARAVFDEIHQSVQEIAVASDPGTGELRIGASEPMLGGFLAAIIAELHRRYPHLKFEIEQPQSVADQHNDLRERRVDLVVGRMAPGTADEDIGCETLFGEAWSVVAGQSNPLARRRKLDLASLLDEPWTLPKGSSAVGRYMMQTFAESGLRRPRNVVTCGSIQMHGALLARGPYLAIFPRSLLHFSPYRMAVKVLPVKLPGTPPAVGITTLKRRTLSPVVQLFIETARELAKPLI
jgi:DNA-binding transcriptional LysR family regulator